MAERSASKSDVIDALGLNEGNVAGKSVLNVGSAEGDLCLAMIKLGASRVVGIDPSVERVKRAREAIAAVGRSVELVEGEFETWERRGSGFDIVICSNALHHMLDPIHALRRLMQLAREKLVIEFAAPALRDVRKYHVSSRALFSSGAGLIAPAYARYSTDLYKRTYLLTPAAIRTMLNQHSVIFEPVKISRMKGAGRHLAIANKRQIEHLTVIAGPTSSGKSTLSRQLDPVLRAELGIPQQDSGYVTASQVHTLPTGRHEHVVLHYDIMRPFESGLHTYERDIATELLSIANRVTFVTIFAAADRLRKQLAESEIDNRRPSKQSPRHLQLLQLYADPNFLHGWYLRWLSYCRQFAGKSAGNFIVENRGTFKVRPESQEEIVSLSFPSERAGEPRMERG